MTARFDNMIERAAIFRDLPDRFAMIASPLSFGKSIDPAIYQISNAPLSAGCTRGSDIALKFGSFGQFSDVARHSREIAQPAPQARKNPNRDMIHA